jgi:hypothetical protein
MKISNLKLIKLVTGRLEASSYVIIFEYSSDKVCLYNYISGQKQYLALAVIVVNPSYVMILKKVVYSIDRLSYLTSVSISKSTCT